MTRLQAEHGVVVAPFEVTVDTLMALRINASDIATLFSGFSNSSRVPDVISAIVFRYTQKSSNKMPASLDVYSQKAKALLQAMVRVADKSAAEMSHAIIWVLPNSSLMGCLTPLSIKYAARRAGFRSEAVYILSKEAAVSNGNGHVQTLAIAATFGKSLLLHMQKLASQLL